MENAVADGVNVGNEIYLIRHRRDPAGWPNRRPATCREARTPNPCQALGNTRTATRIIPPSSSTAQFVVPDQIRTVIRASATSCPRSSWPTEVPKTLIFAKTDSHGRRHHPDRPGRVRRRQRLLPQDHHQADDPKSVLSSFRNDYYPRIAVTVDMIATCTDVKPLECLLFMRDVRSAHYFDR